MEQEVPPRYVDRDLSWLAFNGRVLQEAADPTVPLFERIAFLAIFSSNLDEFFRVRVASLRGQLEKEGPEAGGGLSKKLWQIHEVVAAQQMAFGKIFRMQILPALEAQGILLVDERSVQPDQADYMRTYFEMHVRPHIAPVFLRRDGAAPFLKDKQLYLVTECWPRDRRAEAADYALVEVPSPPAARFVVLPGEGGRQYVMFLDDVIRYNLPSVFPGHEVGSSYAVKLSRDAELDLGDEWDGDLVEKVKESLARREVGAPCRFLYDQAMPFPLVGFLRALFGLKEEDLMLGARYHNFNDFFSFPRFGRHDLSYEPLPPLACPALERAPSLFAAVAAKDRLLHFPYQSYRYVTRFLREAAHDPDVEALWITLYRVAPGSEVTTALMAAAEAGKRVTAFVEVKARFDEAANVRWAEKMEAAGVRILYSLPGLKVHAKVALVVRQGGAGPRRYAYLGTGNFNEKTARLYADHGLLTADPRLTEEVQRVFAYLDGAREEPAFEHLLVAPCSMRQAFYRLIEGEIAQARAGHRGRMILKMNSLEDEEMIARLYEASGAGVQIQLIVRGICRLVPGVKGLSENITALRIVDRFLEHARVYVFYNGGAPLYYLSSADWMRRNLSRRIEVAFPVYDEDARRELRGLLDLQLADNTKACLIDTHQQHVLRPRGEDPPVRAQLDAYRLLQAGLERAVGS